MEVTLGLSKHSSSRKRGGKGIEMQMDSENSKQSKCGKHKEYVTEKG